MIVLASASPARQKLLRDAGVGFVTQVSTVDEAVVKKSIQHLDPKQQALHLAQLKAETVSRLRPYDTIIAADQILDFQGNIFNKAENLDEAFQHLTQLQNKTHHLHSAAVTLIDGITTFQVVQTVEMTMRALTASDINTYLADVGPGILSAVGCYQIEKTGIQLFDHIEGDYFSILGLPLLPLLQHLRQSGHLPS